MPIYARRQCFPLPKAHLNLEIAEFCRTFAGKYKREMFTQANQLEHRDMLNLIRGFADTGRPQVGIFWYDYVHNTLFGVQKDDADRYIDEFNLPVDFPFAIDEHWSIGHGWSSDKTGDMQ